MLTEMTLGHCGEFLANLGRDTPSELMGAEWRGGYLAHTIIEPTQQDLGHRCHRGTVSNGLRDAAQLADHKIVAANGKHIHVISGDFFSGAARGFAVEIGGGF